MEAPASAHTTMVAGSAAKVMVQPDSLVRNVESKIGHLTKQLAELSLIVKQNIGKRNLNKLGGFILLQAEEVLLL